MTWRDPQPIFAVGPVRREVDRVEGDSVNVDMHESFGTSHVPPIVARATDFRIFVAAPCVLAAIQFVGGWVFDRVMAGWAVVVFVPGPVDAGPLRILGADVRSLDSAVALVGVVPAPNVIAVSAELVAKDRAVKQIVCQALKDAHTELVVWGESLPLSVRGNFGPVEHRLSLAARAFKAHALLAAGAEATVGPTEAFREAMRIANA